MIQSGPKMTQNGPQFLFGTEIVWSVQEIHTVHVKILSSNAKDLPGAYLGHQQPPGAHPHCFYERAHL